jgi:hypothetical protein
MALLDLLKASLADVPDMKGRTSSIKEPYFMEMNTVI